MEVLQESPRRRQPRNVQRDVHRLSNELSNTNLTNRSEGPNNNSRESTLAAPDDLSQAGSTSESRLFAHACVEYKKLKGRLSEQKGELITQKDKVEHKKENCKKRINDMFEKLSEILEAKKKEALGKVEAEFDNKIDGLDKLLQEIDTHTNDLNSAMRSETTLDTGELNTIKAGIQDREEFEVMTKELVFDDNAVNTVKEITICDIQEPEGGNGGSDVTDGANGLENRNSRGRISLSTNLRLDDCEDENNTPTNDPQHLPLSRNTSRNASASRVNVPRETNIDDVFNAEGETEVSSSAVDVVPSAPAMESELDEDPPPYWQAIGLDMAEPVKEPQLPLYVELDAGTRLPTNNLEFYHSFPIQRQYDRRTPMASSLTWNGNKICLSDRANQKIKFFYPSGQMITEMFLAGNDIYDVAFLEECNQECRYLIACPRAKNYFIISLSEQGQGSIVKRFNLPNQYGCVCRGTVEQTLIGGDSNDRMGSASVDIFNFNGKIIKTFKFTKNNIGLQYPKAIEMHGSLIIVMDWKLCTVVVYSHDGSTVGEYSGTPTSPLCNTQDITLDHLGNIMVLDSELFNIHVIDLDCNPVEVIKIPRRISDHNAPKLISFNKETKQLAVARSNGDVAIFMFEGGYEGLPQRHLRYQPILNSNAPATPRVPEVLPLVEGMLPSTIENIAARPNRHQRNRPREFHL